ncbi:heavy-metal-associated domain-containing protein [Haladaptatus salinisoli]|uniref:heavy-metal-associated domain-containing protein n=1 Tax=Haladaptatus salinisoli TaxID=2884876 RepID=UPI001D0B761C|nr:heavy metal-associated domain-containing protein [Haladaptatus salinisoli]
MEEYNIEVTGMSCKGCEHAVREKVTGLRGVSSVYPDAQADEVTVAGEPGAAERVRQAIIELGYEAEA